MHAREVLLYLLLSVTRYAIYRLSTLLHLVLGLPSPFSSPLPRPAGPSSPTLVGWLAGPRDYAKGAIANSEGVEVCIALGLVRGLSAITILSLWISASDTAASALAKHFW